MIELSFFMGSECLFNKTQRILSKTIRELQPNYFYLFACALGCINKKTTPLNYFLSLDF